MKGRRDHRHPLDGAVTREGLSQLRGGHPWLYLSQLTKEFLQRLPAHPALVPLGEHWFLYSPHSQIAMRRLGPTTRNWMEAHEGAPITDLSQAVAKFGDALRQILAQAWHRKSRALEGETCFRWIFSDADQLPGLVVELFHETLVAHIQSAPVDWLWPHLRDMLAEVFAQERGQAPREILEIRKGASRESEGLVSQAAPPSERRWLRWNGLEWSMAPGAGQKTGAYFDQRDNHLRAVKWAQRTGARRAWDMCCFEGGFGLHLAHAGIPTLAVDSSPEALDVARRNAQRNGIPEDRYQTLRADVFDEMRRRYDAKERSDLIVLDPPSFSKSRREREGALRGFKELNLRAMHCLEPGGVLISCSCSHSISHEDYLEVLRAAAHDARRAVHTLEVCGPSPDHAPLVGLRESEYLQAWFLEVR